MMTRYEALSALYEKWNAAAGTENVTLRECCGRIAAQDTAALFDLPAVRASSMDGIAVASERFREGMPDTSSWKAGTDFVRTDTGDDFDDRFDAVIPVESVAFLPEGGIRIDGDVRVKKGTNVRPAGSTLRKGDVTVRRGTRLREEHAACLAMSGVSQVKVLKKPVVAFLPTGSELISPGEKPDRGQNFDSNSVMAEIMLRRMGAEPLCLPVVKDRRQELCAALHSALKRADIVVINGGSSKGEEDFNTHILREEGELICNGVRAVPGRPMSIALMEEKPVINLPGPPQAAFFGLEWCVKSLVCAMLGIPYQRRRHVMAFLEEDLYTPGDMEMFLRLDLSLGERGYAVRPASSGAENIADMMSSDAFFVSSLGCRYYPAGCVIDVALCCEEDGI